MAFPPKMPLSFIPFPGSQTSFIYQPTLYMAENTEPPIDVRIKQLDDAIWEFWSVGEDGLVCSEDSYRVEFYLEPNDLRNILLMATDVKENTWKELRLSSGPRGIMDRTNGTECLILYDRLVFQGHQRSIYTGRELIGANPGAFRLIQCSNAASPESFTNTIGQSVLIDKLNKESKCESIISPSLKCLVKPGDQVVLVHDGFISCSIPKRKPRDNWNPVMLQLFSDISNAVVHLERQNYHHLGIGEEQFILKFGGSRICLAQLSGGRNSQEIDMRNPNFLASPFGVHNPHCVPAEDLFVMMNLINEPSIPLANKNEAALRIIKATNSFVVGCALCKLVLQYDFSENQPMIPGEKICSTCPQKYSQSMYIGNINPQGLSRDLDNLGVPLHIKELLMGMLAEDWENRISLEEANKIINNLKTLNH